MRFFKVITLYVLCSVFILFSAPAVYAEDEKTDHQELKQKIIELENRVKDLENLLKISRDSSGKKTEKNDGWWNKKTWRKLKEGMSQEDVEKILGEPVKIIKGHREIWYYPNFYRGYVSFDENGNLSTWIEP
jgi:hypothetical protein